MTSDTAQRGEAVPIGGGLRGSRIAVIALACCLALFNVAFFAFFVLYSRADEWAVDRTESHGGFDPSMLLPNDVLLWLVAHATTLLLVLVDIVAVLDWRMRRPKKRRTARRPRQEGDIE